MQRFFTTFRMTYKQKSNLYLLKFIQKVRVPCKRNAAITAFKQLYIIGNQINTATSHNACEIIIAAKYLGNRR